MATSSFFLAGCTGTPVQPSVARGMAWFVRTVATGLASMLLTACGTTVMIQPTPTTPSLEQLPFTEAAAQAATGKMIANAGTLRLGVLQTANTRRQLQAREDAHVAMMTRYAEKHRHAGMQAQAREASMRGILEAINVILARRFSTATPLTNPWSLEIAHRFDMTALVDVTLTDSVVNDGFGPQSDFGTRMRVIFLDRRGDVIGQAVGEGRQDSKHTLSTQQGMRMSGEDIQLSIWRTLYETEGASRQMAFNNLTRQLLNMLPDQRRASAQDSQIPQPTTRLSPPSERGVVMPRADNLGDDPKVLGRSARPMR